MLHKIILEIDFHFQILKKEIYWIQTFSVRYHPHIPNIVVNIICISEVNYNNLDIPKKYFTFIYCFINHE